MKSLLMMRGKSLSGPVLTKHAGCTKLCNSNGNAIASGSVDVLQGNGTSNGTATNVGAGSTTFTASNDLGVSDSGTLSWTTS